MLKFRCQHCGQRIAVPSRHLGKMVTCSECGAQTHPLAEQIVAAGPGPGAAERCRGAAASAATVAAPGACDNCGAPIGRLQTSYPWNEHVVCGGCYHRLSGESETAASAAPTRTPPAVATPASLVVTRARDDVPGAYGPVEASPRPFALEIRERVLRALIVFVVASVALYGALTLLRDIAGLIAVAAVAVIALLSLYALFRGALAARRRPARSTDLAPLRRGAV